LYLAESPISNRRQLDKRVHRAVARAVAKKAIEQGLARAEYVEYVEE